MTGEGWKRGGAVLALLITACGRGKVPNLVDTSESEATSSLAKAGLHAGAVKLDAATATRIGKILSQSPTAGSPAPAAPGGAVDFVVGAIATPNLAGRTADEAALEINRAGLALGDVRTIRELTGDGRVKDQNPTPGTPVRSGTPVAITIQAGLLSEKLKDGILDQLLSTDAFKKLSEADRQKIEQALRRH